MFGSQMSQLSILALTENGLCLLQPHSTVTLSERKSVQGSFYGGETI